MAVRPTDRWRAGIADEQREVAAGELDAECAVMALLHPASLLTCTDQVLSEFESDVDAFFGPSDERVFGAIERAVLALNAVNDEHDRTGYETGERDQLCHYIEETLEDAGIDVEALAARRGLTRYEITDRWRNW
jgi:hypothetical protein